MSDEFLGDGETPETPSGEGTPEIPTEKTVEKSKELQSALAQKEHFREKAEKLQRELEAFKPRTPETPKENVEVWEAPSDPLEIVKLGKVLSGYSEEETEFIIRNAPEKNIDGIVKASKDTWVQDAIQAKREKVAKENKIPAPSSPGGVFSPVDASKTISDGKVVDAVAKEMAELEAKEGKGGGI